MRVILIAIFTMILILPAAAQMTTQEQNAKQESMNASDLTRAGVVIGNFSGDADGSLTYDRVFNSGTNNDCAWPSIDSGSDGVPYMTHEVMVDTDGSYEFEITLGTNVDLVGFVYCNFDPLAPADDLRAIDDDGGAGLAPLVITDLEANTPYTLVFAGFSNLNTGTYDLEIRGPAGSSLIDEGAAVVPTLGEWGLISLGLVLLIFGVIAIKNRSVALS